MSDSTTQPADTNMDVNEELEPTVDDEINRDAIQADAMNLDGANDTEPAALNGVSDATAAFEARIPVKKDATLREFLGKMDEYAPIVSNSLSRKRHGTLTVIADTRCSYELLSDTCRPAASTSNLPPPRASPRPRDAEVHR